MSLRNKAFSGIRWTAISALGRGLLQFAQIAILARYLVPDDFGVVAIAASFFSFLQIFSEAGIGSAIIQRQNIKKSELSSIFWTNIFVNVALVFLVFVLSYPVSQFYKIQALRELLIISGFTMFVNSLGQQFRFLAQKELMFSPLAKIDLASALVGTLVAVLGAVFGLGVYSIAIGILSISIICSFLLWIRFTSIWKPEFHYDFLEVKGFLNFGIFMIGNNICNSISSQIDILIGGRVMTQINMGLYSVPKDITLKFSNLINPIVTQVGFPLMSKCNGDPSILRKVYLDTLRMTSSVNIAIYAFMALFAEDFVIIFLGKQWAASAPIFTVFCVWAIFRSITNPVGSLLLACGKAKLSFKWNFFVLGFVAIMVFYGSKYGAIGMAVSLLFTSVFILFPSWYFLIKPLIYCSFYKYALQSAIPMCSAAFGALGSSAIFFLMPHGLPRLIAGAATFFLLYILISFFINKNLVVALKEMLFGVRL